MCSESKNIIGCDLIATTKTVYLSVHLNDSFSYIFNLFTNTIVEIDVYPKWKIESNMVGQGLDKYEKNMFFYYHDMKPIYHYESEVIAQWQNNGEESITVLVKFEYCRNVLMI